MILYRIYTENKNREAIEAKLAENFKSFTIIDAVGYWKGAKESSIIIEIFTVEMGRLYRVAEEIRVMNEQQAVLITALETIQVQLLRG